MIPHHVAIIMDGNRRWARQRRFDVLQGHSKGSDTLKNISKKAHEMGVSFLTVFAFSSENWRRPKFEVDGLLKLMKRYLMQDLETLIKDNIKLRIIGDLSAFEPELRELFQDAIARTASNTGLNLSIAVNYGGQQDIVSAVKKLQALNLDDISVDDCLFAQVASKDCQTSFFGIALMLNCISQINSGQIFLQKILIMRCEIMKAVTGVLVVIASSQTHHKKRKW